MVLLSNCGFQIYTQINKKGGKKLTNKKLLREKIESSGLKIKFIVEQMGLTYQGFVNKEDNKTEFTASEISNLCEILSIKSLKERDAIFFAKDVD